jgi:hypothetical protein
MWPDSSGELPWVLLVEDERSFTTSKDTVIEPLPHGTTHFFYRATDCSGFL